RAPRDLLGNRPRKPLWTQTKHKRQPGEGRRVSGRECTARFIDQAPRDVRTFAPDPVRRAPLVRAQTVRASPALRRKAAHKPSADATERPSPDQDAPRGGAPPAAGSRAPLRSPAWSARGRDSAVPRREAPLGPPCARRG